MWYLTSDNDSRVIYVLPFKQIIIGRSVDGQMCNFAIPDDASISRKHATLDNGGNHLILHDLGSRYGTFVNNSTSKIDSNVPIQLKAKDVIKLGKLNSLWTVKSANLVTCTSTLKGESLQNLKSCLNKIGGILKNEWDDFCYYLTMPAITLTIKVVLALVQGSHIVTTEFWSHCIAAVDANQPLPDPKNYTPNIVESTLNKEIVSFNPDIRRRSLFSNKKIVFFSKKQFEMYKSVLTKSCGTPMLLSECKMTKSMLCEQDVIVIQYNITNTESQIVANQVNEIVNYLKNNNKRVIADAEIGLAVLFCNTEKYCNPNFNFTSEVMKQTPKQEKMPTNVLVQESQETHCVSKKENVVINESLTSENVDENNTSNNLFKRKHSNDVTENAHKKFASEQGSLLNNKNNKRKNEDINDEQPNKKMTGASQIDDEIFNFISPSTNKTVNRDNGVGKKLNLMKPQKRKQDAEPGEDDEDNIFNFVHDKTKSNEDSTNNIFNMKKKSRMEINDEIAEEESIVIKKEVEEKIDISALRGRRLEELMKLNLELNGNPVHKIKKEQDDDLDSRMNKLDLGTTIVIINNDLIVKKEPLLIESERNTAGKNFKKFKKVWPLKMQVSVISTSKSDDHINQQISGRDESCSQVY
ncbi:nibrin [Amyelois transitella]|uniref:nibrin n=1 Tax=Amyelois transitella TaxID=680683 RepID=UPI00298FC4EE|nr:nibrin [Amyelois transitella]